MRKFRWYRGNVCFALSLLTQGVFVWKEIYMAREMTRDRQDEHLQLVSRTFALTIPMLGNPLADWVGLAYLVCRTLDTVEDDADMQYFGASCAVV